MPFSEHRRFHRFPVEGIVASLETPGDARVVSLSRTGLTLETRVELMVGTFYRLLLEYKGHRAKVVVDVKWIKLLLEQENESSLPWIQVGASFFDIKRGRDPGLWNALQSDD